MREMAHAEAHRVGHRVEPREEHQEADRHQFLEARLAAVDLAGDDLRDHVVARLGHPRPDQLGQMPQYLLRERVRSEEHTSELQSLMRSSYAVFCLKKKKKDKVIK